MTTGDAPRPAKREVMWQLLAMAMVGAVGLALHFGSGVRSLSNVRDEHLMKVPIDNILREGWSIETAIDYQEVKGPVFFWMYAGPGEVTGDSINALRLVSIAWFALGGVALVVLARQCDVRGSALALVATLYCLGPYNLFTAQLLFSEPSFNCLALWMMCAFVRGHSARWRGETGWAWIASFAILFALLLHHRPHALALGGAAVLTAFIQSPRQALPWAIACAAAGISRIPLYVHWGGMVTSDYQGLFGFGLRLDGLAYMLGVILPWTAPWLLAPWLIGKSDSRSRPVAWMAVAFGIAALLSCIAPPDLSAKVRYTLPSGESKEQAEYAGTVATMLKAVLPTGFSRAIAMAIVSGLGAASLVGLALQIGRRRDAMPAPDRPRATIISLAVFTLACGLPLYVVSAGPVYDRYVAVWMILMPLAWLLTLPRWLVCTQSIIYVAMLGMHVREYLVP